MKTNLTNKKKLAEMIVKAVKEQQQSLEKDLFEKKGRMKHHDFYF